MSKRQNYLEAIDTLLAIINNEELNVQDFNQLYFFIASRHKAEPINLFWKLKESVNCHVSSVSDFKCALEDLKAALEENGYGEHSTTDIEDVLYNYNPHKYFYINEHDRFWEMPIITDSDFIDYKNLSPDEYQVIYDVLYNYEISPSDIICEHYNAFKTHIRRTVALKQWSRVFQKIIDSLSEWKKKSKQGEVCVYIPFLREYKETASRTIHLFMMAQETIGLLLLEKVEKAPIENAECIEHVKDMDKMMEEWGQSLSEELNTNKVYNIVYDERVRRGFIPNKKVHGNEYRRYLISAEEVDVTAIENVVTKNVEGSKSSKSNLKEKVAVIYSMLNDSVENELIQKVVHYAFKSDEEFVGAKASDTIYTYINKPKTQLFDKIDRINKVKEVLRKYGFSDEHISKIS